MFKVKLSAKGYMILFLILLALWGGLQQGGFKIVLLPIFTAIITAVLLDLILCYIKNKKVIIPSSAIITGFIVAMVMVPYQRMIYCITASTIAILSKHFIQREKRHIFNPANFGLLVTLLIFPISLSWWGLVNNWWIAIAGIFMVYKIRRLPVVISYLFTLSILLSVYSLINRGGIFDYLSAINLFFVFIMLIEPKTSPSGILQGSLFGGVVAIAGFIFYLFLPQYDFAIISLAIGNLLNLFLRRI